MIYFLRKIEKDVWVIVVLLFIASYTIFNLKHWEKKERIIVWDVVSYYSYLPATFIYGDVSLDNPNENFNQFDHTFWFQSTEDGKKVFKTTMGMAILYAPFFFATHFYTLANDGIASGFSSPYKFAICLSSLFYFVIGLFFLRKLLRTYFGVNVVAFTLLFVGLGTNLYYYVVIAVGMPHNYLFCILSVLAFLLFKWYKSPTFKLSFIIGLLSGLIVLVRPTMILMLFFAIFFEVNSIQKMKERIIFFRIHLLSIACILLFAFAIWIPQFVYWKIASGNYLFYSYTDEGFFFMDPQFFNALFSFRKGWLLYTPIMTFSLIGLFFLLKTSHKMALPVILTIIVYFYVAICWWDWWYGGSFGYRIMIEMIPLLSFGLACFIEMVLDYSKLFKVTILSFLFILLGFNLFQTRQAHEGLLHHDSMTKAAYFKILFKLQSEISREEVKPFLKSPDYDKTKRGDRD